MGVKAINAVLTRSESRHAARLVLLAIADNADDDGVAWPPIVDRADARVLKSISFKARLSEREVRDSIRELELLGELETTQAQHGRARFNVYHLRIDPFGEAELDERQWPWRLLRPFGVPAESAGGGLGVDGNLSDRPDLREPPKDDRQIPPVLAEVDDRQITAPTTGRSPRRPPADHVPATPGSSTNQADEPSRVTIKENRQQQNQELEEAAAALLGEAPRLPSIVAAVGRFRSADIRSIRVVEPLAVRLQATVFEEVVERALGRRGVDNDVGLFVQLLRIAVDERVLVERRQVTDAVDAAEEARLARQRQDPEAYLHRLLALPHPAHPDAVKAFLSRYVDQPAELDRLRSIEKATRKATRSPVAAVKHWIEWVSTLVEPAAAHDQVDEWLNEQGLSDHVERSMLHDRVDELLEPAAAVAAVEAAA